MFLSYYWNIFGRYLTAVYSLDFKSTTGLKVCVNLKFKLILKQLVRCLDWIIGKFLPRKGCPALEKASQNSKGVIVPGGI